jgi:SAM-dependent methyltransferase
MASRPSTKRHPVFARFYARISPTMDAQGAVEHRRTLLAGLAGRVLEVGAGNGLNFSMDAAVTSLVLCSVPDQARALAELHRVLRPGGELRFLEHVRADTVGLARVQRLADHIWPTLVGGCHQPRHPGRYHHRRVRGHQPPAVPVPREPAATAGRTPRPWDRPPPTCTPARGQPTAGDLGAGRIVRPTRRVGQLKEHEDLVTVVAGSHT